MQVEVNECEVNPYQNLNDLSLLNENKSKNVIDLGFVRKLLINRGRGSGKAYYC